jgi:hypothetical protein
VAYTTFGTTSDSNGLFVTIDPVETGLTTLPRFGIYLATTNEIEWLPTMAGDTGSYSISTQVKNAFLVNNYPFTVTVTSDTPSFSITSATLYQMIGDPAVTRVIPSWTIINMPTCALPITYSAVSVPTGVTYDSSTWTATVYVPTGTAGTYNLDV